MGFQIRSTARLLRTPHSFLSALLAALMVSCAPDPNPTQGAIGSPQANAGEHETAEAPAHAPSSASGSAVLGARDGDWQAYAGDIGSTKYTPLANIDASNVASLEVVWRRPALDAHYSTLNPNQRFSSNYVAAPVVIDGVAYIPNAVGFS